MMDLILTSESGSLPDINKSIHIGLLCVQEEIMDRPNMVSVVLMLNSSSITLRRPSEPAFFMCSNTDPEKPLVQETGSGLGKSIISKSRSRSPQSSVNEVKITGIAP